MAITLDEMLAVNWSVDNPGYLMNFEVVADLDQWTGFVLVRRRVRQVERFG